jgi:hypothetical protein
MNPRIAVPLFTVIAFAIAMALTGAVVAPDDVWPNILLSGFFLLGIGLAGGFLVAVHDVSNGRWLGPVRRIACGFTRLVLPGWLVVFAALVLGWSHLYGGHHLIGFKALWLDRAFVTARAIVYMLAWFLSLRRVAPASSPAVAAASRRARPAAYLVIFAFTVWLASVDWIMALEAEWSSTIFGVYHFAGLFTAGLAAIVIVAVNRSRSDASITSDHLHDLGKMLFAFSTFWMYIWFSQAMLIWYGNLAEEIGFYARRAYGNWGVLFWATVVLMWAIPFLVLLPESTKRNRTILSRIAVAILIGHWLDLYVAIVPAHTPAPHVTGWELALALGAFAAVGWVGVRRSPEVAMPPVLQPRLVKS